ncbi:MAG: transcription-repair coupling factor [Lachnospiraceae bacterium]|nr:transcription-repair coupling factor [Lachnospiraceae bacterium]
MQAEKYTLVEPLSGLREYEELREKMRKTKGVLSVTGCVEAQKAHLIYGLSYDVPVTLVVAEHDLAARTLFDNLSFYDPEVMLYPAKDLLFYQADVASNLLDQQRMAVMRRLIEQSHLRTAMSGKDGGITTDKALERAKKARRVTVVLPVTALMDFVTKRGVAEAERLYFIRGEESDFEEVKKILVLLGYERCAEAHMPGQFAVRGDILDVWSLTEEHPVRIEYFGDEIDGIRSFDAESQRSILELEDFTVYPAHDHTGDTAPFLSWFDMRKTQIFLDEPNRLAEAARAAEAELQESVAMRAEKGTLSRESTPEICSASALFASVSRMHVVGLSMLDMRKDNWEVADTYSMTVQAVTTYRGSFDYLAEDLKKYRRNDYRVVLLSGSHTRAKRLASDLADNGISAYYTEDFTTPLSAGQVAVVYGHANRGFAYPHVKFAVIAESDIFGEKKVRKRRRVNPSGEKIARFSDLHVGDYVVHENHGLGIYRGIEKVESDGILKDYIKIEYNGSNLYILATQLEMLQKYSGGGENAKPRLSKLGGRDWEKTREKVRTAVKNIAGDLVKLYAARMEMNGFVYGPDTEWQREFEELFPYEETEDQLAAIEDTKRDMESRKIMDRLICGDVGYGKTEIAIRAAFKAVQENRQVAYLVPTTILAQQHYNTFSQRMKDFPVRVDLMCRFRTPAQISNTIHDLKAGYVDIVIGTHRMLSKDVKFKNLGLLIIDEEQRFGVAHKEKIKQLRENVDVLTLTATPIPRTLHMSLIGIRDMSVLEEAPESRVPIQTYVMEFNEELVREAISRELARGGQVYYVYNRVRDIDEMTRRVKNLVPEASVEYADGQMGETALEQVMVDFVNGEIDVLVTTTIIETGLDIGNVNTIIIHDADKMGLSQLYQLRGRVGRTNRTAYAFLMYRRDKILSEVAEKRLSAIREFTELGSGFRIAMRDLEIRGAGNLLGAEQSGHMASVGYDLYCKMLEEAVSEAKGETREEEFETVVDLSLDAFIPDSYIPNEFQKLNAYKRIAGIAEEGDMEDIGDELLDRYGEPPAAVTNLMKIADLKAAAHRASVKEVKEMYGRVKITVNKDPKFDVREIPRILAVYKGAMTIRSYENETFFEYNGRERELKLVNILKTFFLELAETGKRE